MLYDCHCMNINLLVERDVIVSVMATPPCITLLPVVEVGWCASTANSVLNVCTMGSPRDVILSSFLRIACVECVHNGVTQRGNTQQFPANCLC